MYYNLDNNEIDWGAEIERKLNEDVVLNALQLTLILIKSKTLN